ncbi:MAG: phosphocholine cytidylyltransferase family protein [Candidatus Altiarchaeota archaeon]|nr:phosphocholine cytidylyltransferase family protein [Candidatus Altiarchaeota archaeon]
MPLTQRNIEIDSDTWSKLKADAIGRNKNVRELAGEILADHVHKKVRRDAGKGMKAIILAAGMSSRLMDLTDDKPKCMLEIGGKTIMQRQIETFHQCGIEDITVVRGYKKEKINYTGVKYVYNQNYRRNNMLESLMYARSDMDSEFICGYSDILYDKGVLEKLLKSKADFCVVVDTDWMKHYKDRFQHPIEEAENVVVEKGKIKRMGKTINANEAHGEFIGLAKFSTKGAEILRKEYARVRKKLGLNSPFHEALSLEKAYLTDMLQELVERGHRVESVDIKGGWMELDTIEDLQKAEKRY